MEKIDKYINSIYKGMNHSSKETEDLKQEMRNHLNLTVKELQENGISEEESIRIAIERFGGELQIRSELNQVLRFQRLFAHKTLIASIILFVLSAIVLMTSYFVRESSSKRLHIMDSQLKIVENKFMSDGITGVDTYLKELFKDEKSNSLTYVAVKELPKDFDYKKDNGTYHGETKYSYPEKIKSEYYSNCFGHELNLNGIRYFLETGVKTSYNTDSSYSYSNLAALLFAICWVLWIIWSIVNINGYGYLNTKWCILIIFTGILGYFIFSLSVNPQNVANNKRNIIIYMSVFCLIATALIVHNLLSNPYRFHRLLDLI